MSVYDDRQSFRSLHATANPEKYDLAPIKYRHPHRALFKQNHENLNREIQGVRKSVQKRITGPERRKERATFCGRFGKWTSFLLFRVQLRGYETSPSEKERQ